MSYAGSHTSDLSLRAPTFGSAAPLSASRFAGSRRLLHQRDLSTLSSSNRGRNPIGGGGGNPISSGGGGGNPISDGGGITQRSISVGSSGPLPTLLAQSPDPDPSGTPITASPLPLPPGHPLPNPHLSLSMTRDLGGTTPPVMPRCDVMAGKGVEWVTHHQVAWQNRWQLGLTSVFEMFIPPSCWVWLTGLNPPCPTHRFVQVANRSAPWYHQRGLSFRRYGRCRQWRWECRWESLVGWRPTTMSSFWRAESEMSSTTLGEGGGGGGGG